MPEIVKPSQAPVRGNFPVIPITQAPNLTLDYFYNQGRDVNYRPGMVQSFNRADNQSWLAQLGNGLASRGLSIGTKTLAGLGSVGTALAVPFTSATVDDIWNNPLTQWANNLDQSLNETFPVFQSQAYAEGDLLQKMMTTSFWATDGMDGLAFAASAFIPGKVIGAGLKSLESGQIGAHLFDKLSKIGINAHKTNLVASTAYNTISEAAAEAYQTQKELEAIYQGQGYTAEQSKLLSAKAARETFGANLAVLAIPNYIQNRMFHGAWADKTAAARKAAIESGGKSTAQDLLGAKWKDVTGGFISEGLWEENAQTSVQQYERAKAKGFTDYDMTRELVDNFYSNMKGFAKSVLPGDYDVTPEQEEGAISIALGGLLGMGFGLRSSFADAENIKSLVKNENEAYTKFATEVLPAAQNSFKDNIRSVLKQNGTKKIKDGDKEIEVPNYEVDDQGNYVIDQDAVHKMLVNGMHDMDNWSIDTLAAMANNSTIGTLNKEVALASFAHDLATSTKFYSKEDIQAILDNYTKVGTAEAEQAGTKTEIRENMALVSEYVKASVDTYNKYATADSVKDPKEFQFRTFLAKTDLYLQAKLNALNKLLANPNANALEINKLIFDTTEQQKFLKDKVKSLRELYNTVVDKPTDLTLKLQELNKKQKKTQEDYDKIREYSYLLNEEVYANGTYALQQTGARTNPIGLNTSQLVKTRLGRKDELNDALGTSWLSLRKAEQHLNQPTPDIKQAELAFSQVTADVDSQLAADIVAKLNTAYEEAENAINEEVTKLDRVQNALNELSSVYAEEGDVAGTVLTPETMEVLQLTPDSPISQDLLDSYAGALYEELSKIAPLRKELNKLLTNLQSKKDFINNWEERASSADSRAEAYRNASDPENFLKEEYFRESVQEPAQNFIDYAKANPDDVEDLGKATEILNQLRSVVTTYTNRQDPHPKHVKDKAVELIEEISEVIRLINKNLNNRTLMQTITNDRIVENTLKTLNSSPELVELLESILGSKLPTQKELSTDTILSYDALVLVVSQIRAKATLEQLKKIDEILLAEKDRLLTSIWDNLPDSFTKSKATQPVEFLLTKGSKWYGKIPHSQVANLIKWTLPKGLTSEILLKFYKDLDVLSLQLNLNSIPELNDEQRESIFKITNAHFELTSLLALNNALVNAKVDVGQLLSLKEPLSPAPSLQQNILIQEALDFLHSKVGTEKFGNWFIANGIAGSGKTHIVANLVPALWAKLNAKSIPTSVFAFSKSQLTSENINRAVGLKTTTFGDFSALTNEQLKSLEILIIDEVYTFSNDEISSIQKRLLELAEQGHTIKVLALGDLSQLTAEEKPVLQEPFTGNAKIGLPLTTSFRTNVDAIAVFANQFRLKASFPKETFVTASASVESIISNSSDAFGVSAMSENDVVAALRNPSSRTRVLIVPTSADVSIYKQLLPQVSVVTPEEAQGYQWDEVYAIINPYIYPDNFAVNQAIYTTVSRAKSLLVVSGLPISNTAPRDIENTLMQEQAILSTNEQLFKASIDKAKEFLKNGVQVLTQDELTPKRPPTQEDEEMPLAEEDVETESSDTPVVVDITPVDTVPDMPGAISLAFPKNRNIKPLSVDGQLVSPIDTTKEGHIIRTKRNNQDFYFVIAPHITGGFTVIGALGNSDFQKYPQLSSLVDSKVKGIPSTRIDEFRPFTLSPSDLEASSVQKIQVSGIKHLRTIYSPNAVADADLGTHAGGLDVIEDAIVKFYNSFYGIDSEGNRVYPAEVYDAQGNVRHLENDWIVNGRPNWNVLKDKVELRIMTEKERSKIAAENPDFNFVLKGVPYLVIKEAKQKGSKIGSAQMSYYVQLQPNKLSKDSERLQPIKELRDALLEIEAILGSDYTLGTRKLADLVDSFAIANFTVAPDNRSIIPQQTIDSTATLNMGLAPEQYTKLDELLKTVVSVTYGAQKKLEVFNTKEDAEKFLDKSATKNPDGTWALLSNETSTDTGQPKKYIITEIAPMGKKFILKYAASLEDLDNTKNFEQYSVRRGAGSAQHQLNALAMANKAAGDIPFRVTSTSAQGGRSITLTRSKSILAHDTVAFDLELFLRDARVENSGWTRTSFKPSLGTTATTQAIEHLTKTYDASTARAIIKQYTVAPVTIDLLNAIVDEAQFENGRHISLRTPLQLTKGDLSGVNDIGTDHRRSYKLDQDAARRSITQHLTSHFQGMQRTEVQIIFSGTSTAVTTPKVHTIADALSNLKGELRDLLVNIKAIQNVPILKQDHVVEEGKRVSLIQNGVVSAVTHISPQYPGGVAVVSPLDLDAIPNDTILHEIVHVATSNAIEKGKTDPEGTKERIFYQRIVELQNIFNQYLIDNKIDPTTVYAETRSELDEHEFIANLSHSNFVQLAKKVKVEKRSLLSRILDAILDLLGGDSNVYDSLFKTLEDYYSTQTTLKIVVKQDLELDKVDAALQKLVQSFNDPASIYEKYLTGVYDVKHLKKTGEFKFTPIFNKKNDATKYSVLSNLYNTLLGLSGNTHFAIINTPAPKLIATKGSALDSSGLSRAISNFFPEYNNLEDIQRNLLYSILHYQVTHAGLNYINNLLTMVKSDDHAALAAELWNIIMSNEDRQVAKTHWGIQSDRQAVLYFKDHPESDLMVLGIQTIELIRDNLSTFEQVVGSLEDRMPYIYKGAKDYVLELIRANQLLKDSTTELMKTRYSLFVDVLAKVQGNTTAGLRLQLASKVSKLEALRNANNFNNDYYTLLYSEIPELENKISGIEALKTINTRTGNLFVEDIYREIYPKDPLNTMDSTELAMEVAELEYATGDTDEEIKATVNINEHIKEYNKSPELTLSESMKDFLFTASVESSSGTQKYLSNGLMFIKLLQLAATLEFKKTDTASTLNNVYAQLQEKLSKDLSDVDRSVLQVLSSTIETIIHPNESIPTSVTIVTGTDAGGNIWYAGAKSSRGEDISNLTYDELVRRPGVSITSQQVASNVLYSQLERIYPELTIQHFNHLFSRAEAINVMKGIINTIVSLRETDLYIGASSYQGGLVHKMMRSKASGITFAMKETIREALQEHYNSGTFFTALDDFQNSRINNRIAKSIPESGNPADKLEYIRKFYSSVIGLQGINIGVSIASDASGKLQDYVTQIKNLIEVAQRVDKASAPLADELLGEDSPESEVQDSSFSSFIDNIDGYLTRLSEFASLSSEYLRNPSVRTLKGDRYYKWHESSFGSDTLAAIVDVKSTSALKGATGSNTYRRIPEHLLSNFYNHNIFVRAPITNKIYATGEWEGSLNEDNGSGVPYLRETYRYFYQRKYLMGFLDMIRQYEKSYMQYIYVPSDKPKNPLARIDVLGDSEIIPTITLALKQILESSKWRANVENFNKSKTQGLFRNFELAAEVIEELNIEFNEENIPKIATAINAKLEAMASSLIDTLVSSDIEIKLPKDYHKTYAKAQKLLNPIYSEVSIPTNNSGNFDFTKSFKYEERTRKIKEVMLPTFELFIKNNYVNSYFLNQLIAGDFASYKSAEDIVKRYAGVLAPGVKGLVDEQIGMRENYKVMILEDTHIDFSNTEQVLRNLLFESNTPTATQEAELQRVLKFFDESGYDMTDAQGFMTPKRYKELGRGFERAWYRGAVHKPVHFEVQQVKVKDEQGNQLYDAKGHPLTAPIARYTKYSSIVLSDEMLNTTQSPALRALRDKLERLDVDEVLFKSGIKEGGTYLMDEEGIPLFTSAEGNHRWMRFDELINADDNLIATLSRLDSFQSDDNFKGGSGILTLSNRHFRLQHNPAADPNKQVSIYTQLMYFLNVFSNSSLEGIGVHPSLKGEADRVYNLIGELIAMGRTSFESQINTPASLRKFLRNKFADSPNAERVAELLEARISFNNPLVESKAVIAIASGMEAATVKVKFSGGKLVLQSAIGIEITTGEKVNRELGYVAETINNRRVMVAEVLVPEAMLTLEMKEALANNQPLFAFGDGMGFRIPSTELHSAVPLKIVGTYNSVGKDNVIIAPKELVPIHGSDFDVDALFVILRENFSKKESVVLNAQVVIEYQKVIKQFFSAIESLNTTGQYTEYLNNIKKQLGFVKDEPIDNFIDQSELEDRFTTYISTPNFDPITKRNITRIEDPNFEDKELVYRQEWGKLHGYGLSKDKDLGFQWKVENVLLASIYELQQSIEEAPEEIKKLLPPTLSQSLEIMPLGQAGTPVGYEKSTGVYQIDPYFIEITKEQIKGLKELVPDIHIDVRGLILPTVNASIKQLERILEKAIKNNITETMLRIITDIDRNGYRMLTPINFAPLREAIASLGKTSKAKLDLSDIRSEYQAFHSLSSGAVLTGAFANAAKVFAYLTQAGASETTFTIIKELSTVTGELKDLQAQLDLLDKANEADLSPEELSAKESLLATREIVKAKISALEASLKLARAIKTSETFRGQINPKYQFTIDNQVYDRLETRDKANKYNITETLDTLINAAIDNLKLGLLGQAKINTLTGSAVVGGVFMGMPLDLIVKLLNQPILNTLSTGISDKKEAFLYNMREKYSSSVANDSLTTEQLEQGLSLPKDPEEWSEADISVQLAVLDTFNKLNTVGEDARNLSSFLGVIQDMKVSVKKLDALDHLISNKVGTINSSTFMLTPNKNFSFIAPNLLTANPHILEAYKTHLSIQELVSKYFSLHSPYIRKFAKQINEGLDLDSDSEVKNVTDNLANIREALAHYLLARQPWQDLASRTRPKTIILSGKNNKSVKVTLSVTRTFMQETADKLKAVQNFARENNIKNMFLDNVFIGTDRMGVPLIQFRGGVNLHAEDHAQISLDFRNLNRFSIDANNNVTFNTNVTSATKSVFQRELVNYAIIAYGLSYGAANFSIYIPATFIQDIDKQFNEDLKQFNSQLASKSLPAGVFPHFKLSYVTQNASRLGFISFGDIITTGKNKNDKAEDLFEVAPNQFEGGTVYFDLRAKTPSKGRNPNWVKEGWGNRTTVYKKVASSNEYDYYQKVGKVRDLYYTPLNNPETYSLSEYFNPYIYTLPILYREGNVVYSSVKVDHFIDDTTPLYIVPFYNFDRTERTLVKITSAEKATGGKYPGYKYIIEEVDSTEKEVLEVNRPTYIGLIKELKENEIFVFGSNPLGINGNPSKGTGGAALVAYNIASVKQGERMDNKLSESGKAWGITTVSSPGAKRSKTPEQIKEGIKMLYDYAASHPDKRFLIAYQGRVGSNLNGYTNAALASMFSSFPIPSNIIFEKEFATLLEDDFEQKIKELGIQKVCE